MSDNYKNNREEDDDRKITNKKNNETQYNENNSSNECKIDNYPTTSDKTNTNTREANTITDICCSDNLAEVDLFSLINENLPLYKLRADTVFTHNNSDWIEAPLFIDEQQISQLTNEQIRHTLDYFILSGYRVSQMTKTYYDIDAVNKLLEEKERDLELAATIGKQLLDNGQILESKIELLEEQLQKATDMINQLRYEINMKDDLLQNFIEIDDNNSLKRDFIDVDYLNNSNGNLDDLRRRISHLENENYLLKNDADNLKEETNEFEKKEQMLIDNCVKELAGVQSEIESIQEELKNKNKECSQQQDEISNLYDQIMRLQDKIKDLTVENSELKSICTNAAETQNELVEEITSMRNKYNECLEMLHNTQEELRVLRRKYAKKSELRHMRNQQRQQLYSPWMTANSLAAEMHFGMNQEQALFNYKQKRESFELVKKVREKLIKSIPGSNIDSCLPSDSEFELMMNSSNSINFGQPISIDNIIQSSFEQTSNDPNIMTNSRYTNNSIITNVQQQQQQQPIHCYTPDSYLSTGSASILSSNVSNNLRSYLPDKLQIVKPFEGSQTLQHWQQLATPNLGCLIEPRPGIYIKGKDPNVGLAHGTPSTSSEENDETMTPVNREKSLLKRANSNSNNFDEDLATSDLDVTFDMEEDYDNDDDLFFYGISAAQIDNCTDNLKTDAISSLDTSNTNVIGFSSEEVNKLTKLLTNEELEEKKMRQETSNSSTTKDRNNNSKDVNSNVYLEEIRNLSTKYYQAPYHSDNLKIDNRKYEFKNLKILNKLNNLNLKSHWKKAKKRKAYAKDDYVIDTPPPSPTFCSDDSDDEYEDDDKIATPPGTPTNELADTPVVTTTAASTTTTTSTTSITSSITVTAANFFDQIVRKLSSFSFRSLSFDTIASTNKSTTTTSTTNATATTPTIVKPTALYCASDNNNRNTFPNSYSEQNNLAAQIQTPATTPCAPTVEPPSQPLSNGILPDTPPCSPTCITPPPSAYVNTEINEEIFKNSAFVKLSTLNPLINKSVDLASLLDSISSLKRSQRLCKS